MEAKDLRFGNLIYKDGVDWDSQRNPVGDPEGNEVVFVDLKILEEIEKFNGTTQYNHYSPIPLTEEWLLKMGFKKFGEWFTYRDFPIELSISLVHKKTTFGYNEEYEIKHLEFVHSVQNLIHALTNTELTINL